MAISLSLSTISILFLHEDALLRPSNAKPPLMEASPITATMLRLGSFFIAEAIAMPKAADIEFDA